MRHQRLVYSLAHRFRKYGEPLEDLVQEGFLGLLRAIDHYEPQHGARFSSYAATKILSSIRHYLRDRHGLIRQPAGKQELRYRMARESARLRHLLNREPTALEIASSMEVSEDQVAELQSFSDLCQVQSLEELREGDDPEEPAWDPLADERPSGCLHLEEEIALRQALENLDERRARVLRLVYFEQQSCAEAAETLGVTYAQARLLISSSLSQLRRALDPEAPEPTTRS
jgi:RNA polymerase sigma-B factor